jgi:hypothetical protein
MVLDGTTIVAIGLVFLVLIVFWQTVVIVPQQMRQPLRRQAVMARHRRELVSERRNRCLSRCQIVPPPVTVKCQVSCANGRLGRTAPGRNTAKQQPPSGSRTDRAYMSRYLASSACVRAGQPSGTL